jgi:hypothetical protein
MKTCCSWLICRNVLISSLLENRTNYVLVQICHSGKSCMLDRLDSGKVDGSSPAKDPGGHTLPPCGHTKHETRRNIPHIVCTEDDRNSAVLKLRASRLPLDNKGEWTKMREWTGSFFESKSAAFPTAARHWLRWYRPIVARFLSINCFEHRHLDFSVLIEMSDDPNEDLLQLIVL